MHSVLNKQEQYEVMVMISVILPVFNEELYLAQCLDSILAQEDADFEVCISDNASTAGTWEIISRYSCLDSRIKSTREEQAIYPLDNVKNALSMAVGDYIYILGGDDYLLPGFFKTTLALFKDEPRLQSVLVRMNYFSDRDGSIIATQPPQGFDTKLNTSASRLVNFMLHHINHDEVVLGLFKREEFIEVLNILGTYSQESAGIWLFLGSVLQGKHSEHRVRITQDVYLMKRYEKPAVNTSNYSKSAEKQHTDITSKYLAYCGKSAGSVMNAIRFYKARLFSWRELLLILLAPRFHSSFGFHSVGPLISPVWIFVAYPVRKLKNTVFRLFSERCHDKRQ
jgi:glycosyltransferase involved in cell wall biosynthesis